MQTRRHTLTVDGEPIEVELSDIDMGYHGHGTHMSILEPRTGAGSNVFVYYENGQPKLKGMVQQLEFTVPSSPALNANSEATWDVVESPLESGKYARLLEIYKQLE